MIKIILMMKTKLAMFGAKPEIKKTLKPYTPIGCDDVKAVEAVFKRGVLSDFLGSPSDRYFGGTEVRQFEKLWCDYFNVPYSIAVNSATSGLIAAMGAVGITPGDEVIVPPYTMSATVVAPLFYGGIPVFVDIEDNYFCINPECVEQAITPRTKAIVAVNLFGHPAELHKLRALADKHGVYLIEDNAQAICATERAHWAGTIGHIGIFSLNVHKHLNVGEGGVIVTNEKDLATRLQLIRNHGENATDWLHATDITNLIGYNFRLTELHAAVAANQFKNIKRLTERVTEIGNTLSKELINLPGLTVPQIREECIHRYFMWSCKIDSAKAGISRNDLCKALIAEGVPLAQGYVKPLYYLPVFQKRIAIGSQGFPFNLSDISYHSGLCPIAELMHFEQLFQFQPVSWEVDSQQLESIIAAFHKVFENIDEIIQPRERALESLK